MGQWFEALGEVGSSGVSCDGHVLEPVKAKREVLNRAAKWMGRDWSFDEKNEFRARTGFDPKPRATMIFHSGWVEPFETVAGVHLAFLGTFELGVWSSGSRVNLS